MSRVSPLDSLLNPWTSHLIQPMTINDLREVMAIEKDAYLTPWPQVAYEQGLTQNTVAYFDVLKYPQEIIGYSGMWHFVDEIHLGTLVTHPTHRGEGLGEFLLLNVLNRGISLLAEVVTLEVRPSNIAAVSLYLKYGFDKVGWRKRYYQDGEDALIMTTPGLQTDAYQTFLIRLIEPLSQRLADFFNELNYVAEGEQH